ncbi:MAG: glycosyltransferase family 2 protein [Planctomycetes bacterium]|nr:glycosyltransferase family 2 protein [Planctomycetota bacterium]
MTAPVVLVVIVSRDTKDAAVRCARSVLDRGTVNDATTRLVVVDNASSDGTADALRGAFGGRIDVIANADNRGFGAACNQGAAVVPDARHVLVLNADAELTPGALEALVAELESNPGVGACGPRVVGDDGSPRPSVRGHPTRLALLHQHTALRFLRVGAAAFARYRSPSIPLGDASSDAEVVLGACVLVRGDDFRAAKGFDERYFLYFEEADLERRLAESGRRVRYVPTAVVRHTGGASSRRDPERALTWYLCSLFLYVDRWYGRGAGLVYRALFKPLFVVRLVTDAARDAAVLLVRGREQKRDELRLTARFALRGFWTFLLA